MISSIPTGATTHGLTTIAAIPYARTSAVSVGSMLSAILITLVLLGAVAVALWFARKNGWLRPWLGTGASSPRGDDLKVLTRTRLSPTARALVFEHEGSRFLIVESSQHLSMHPCAATAEETTRDA